MSDIHMAFEVTKAQYAKYKNWMIEQDKKSIEIQKKNITKDDPFYDFYKVSWEMGHPYCGAIGGGEHWLFIPTSIGDICHVKNTITGEEVDLTEEGNFG